AALAARRSLLALDNLAAAIDTVLTAPAPLRRAFIAADPQALTIAEMVAAMREGLGRRPGVFPLPTATLRWMLHASGQDDIFERRSAPLVPDPPALLGLGWSPPLATRAGLAALMRAGE